MSAIPVVHNHHNVCILGAGYGADACYPLVADFMATMRAAHEWVRRLRRTKDDAAISQVLAFRHRAAGAAYRTNIDVENIEELFSLASALGDHELEAQMGLAIAATLDYAHNRSKGLIPSVRVVIDKGRYVPADAWRPEKHLGGETSVECRMTLYDVYAAILAGGLNMSEGRTRNTIITFNYDLLLEESLDRLQVPYHYGLERASALCQGELSERVLLGSEDDTVLLKLHGSVNWVQGEKLTVWADRRQLDEAGHPPSIVPPTWRRKYAAREVKDQLQHIWMRAVDELRAATYVVILGYSLPETDVHFRYLLGAGLSENISLRRIVVVNPDRSDRIPRRLFSILRPELDVRGTVSIDTVGAQQFLLDKERLASLDRQPLFESIGFTAR